MLSFFLYTAYYCPLCFPGIMGFQGIEYEVAKAQVKEKYLSIGRVQSPALCDHHVVFTSEGFRHLARKGRIPRTKSEQYRRFLLLPFVREVIAQHKVHVEFRRTFISINRASAKADFWTFLGEAGGHSIKVVIRQINNGSFRFLSVMSNSRNKKLPR